MSTAATDPTPGEQNECPTCNNQRPAYDTCTDPYHGEQNELPRHMLNDAYQYGLEAQGQFNAALANAALSEINRRLEAIIHQHTRQARIDELEKIKTMVPYLIAEPRQDWVQYMIDRLAALRQEETKQP